jgi:hypothetical protein
MKQVVERKVLERVGVRQLVLPKYSEVLGLSAYTMTYHMTEGILRQDDIDVVFACDPDVEELETRLYLVMDEGAALELDEGHPIFKLRSGVGVSLLYVTIKNRLYAVYLSEVIPAGKMAAYV